MGDDFLFSGDPLMSNTAGITPDYNFAPGYLPGDWSDQQQMGGWNPAPATSDGGQPPWWAGIAAYGITRAIDNTFPGSPTGIMGNTYPGSIAGVNGRTYTTNPLGLGGGVASAQARLSGNPLLMVALLAGAYLLLRR